MHEPQAHAGRDLVELGVVLQVSTNSPIVLAERLIVDPAAAGSLEHRVAQEEHEPATVLENAGNVVDRGLERVDVLQRQTQEHRVKGAARTRQFLGARSCVAGTASTRPSRTQLRQGWIETHDIGTRSGDAACYLAFAASDVENASRAPKMTSDKGENLFLVLSVRP